MKKTDRFVQRGWTEERGNKFQVRTDASAWHVGVKRMGLRHDWVQERKALNWCIGRVKRMGLQYGMIGSGKKSSPRMLLRLYGIVQFVLYSREV